MLNLRRIDKKFFLSGGWENPMEDVLILKNLGIGAVLDLQYTPDDHKFNKEAEQRIKAILEHNEIEYWITPMFDGEQEHIEDIFTEGHDALFSWLGTLDSKTRLLVKCGNGVSRSPAMLIYFYCQEMNMSYEAAYNLIYKAGDIYIDSFFKDWLKVKFSSYRDEVFGEEYSMSAFIRLPGAPTKDIRKEGIFYRYCALCDAHYVAGSWKKHRETLSHMAAESDKKKMDRWYAEVGS